jgi:exodeoxyribonuclease VII large subunit
VSVQGTGAHLEIIAALELAARRAECDVLILARGGGSLEDLWAFNSEALARAIVACPIPVVSGVGHEIDVTIADYAADVRAATPSAAAEIAVPDGGEWLERLSHLDARLKRSMVRFLDERSKRLKWLMGRAAQVSPSAKLAQRAQRLDELEQRLVRAARRSCIESRSRLGELRTRLWQASPLAHLQASIARHKTLDARLRVAVVARLKTAQARLGPLARTLNAVSPLATLERGYAIVTKPDGSVLREATDAKVGSEIEARLGKGRIRARVESSS